MKTRTTLRSRLIGLVVCLMVCVGVTSLQAQAPTITSFTPASGSVGTLVTVSGTNLSNPIAFTVGGVNAIVVSNTGSNLVGMVMPGAVTGAVVVNTTGGTANSSSNFTVTPTSFPSVQQGGKLVGTGSIGISTQGYSVAMSANGNTAVVGGYYDSTSQGAAWVFIRSGGIWMQQGAKLKGTGNNGAANQGISVSLSADGNTALIGGDEDNFGRGAAWVFTRIGGTWTQQGSKLVGTGGAFGGSGQGCSVSLSADGNTAILGGHSDSMANGAAWIFTRTGSTWMQQGAKLVGTGGIRAQQGISVSMSADGNTAIVGGAYDNSQQGAAWIFTRNSTTWSQQGTKLVGMGGSTLAEQGSSVALNADGNTALIGAVFDSSSIRQGAAWVFTRVGGTWTQQGPKLVGTGGDEPNQGTSVSLSADGNTALIGGKIDNNSLGATWIFTRNGNTWTQQGAKLVGTGATGNVAYQGSSVSLSADGNTAIVGGYADNGYTGAAWVFTSSSTFPVKLISFTVEKQGTNNFLHWATTSEQNNQGFELQRSADGEHFSKLTFINSKAFLGNTVATLTYDFTDKSPLSGNNYYRLKQVDYDGKATISKIVLIKGETGDESMTLSLYPNPGSSRFTLTVNSSNTQPVSIRVMDAVGHIVYEATGNAAQQFNFGEKFANGTYLVEVRQGDAVKTMKAVKMK